MKNEIKNFVIKIYCSPKNVFLFQDMLINKKERTCVTSETPKKWEVNFFKKKRPKCVTNTNPMYSYRKFKIHETLSIYSRHIQNDSCKISNS